jgi:hypothetical protein
MLSIFDFSSNIFDTKNSQKPHYFSPKFHRKCSRFWLNMPYILILISIFITPQFVRCHIFQVYFPRKLGKNNEDFKNLRVNIEIEIIFGIIFPEIMS